MMSGPPINPNNPSNAMLLTAINKIFSRLDEQDLRFEKLRAEMHEGFSGLHEAIGALAMENAATMRQLAQHIGDRSIHT